MTTTTAPAPATTTRDDYIVMFWNTHDHWQWTPTAIGNHSPAPGVVKRRDVKDVQDDIAEYAGKNPHIIYMVVLADDYYGFFRTGFWHKR